MKVMLPLALQMQLPVLELCHLCILHQLDVLCLYPTLIWHAIGLAPWQAHCQNHDKGKSWQIEVSF